MPKCFRLIHPDPLFDGSVGRRLKVVTNEAGNDVKVDVEHVLPPAGSLFWRTEMPSALNAAFTHRAVWATVRRSGPAIPVSRS
jgi:hypothetical protein